MAKVLVAAPGMDVLTVSRKSTVAFDPPAPDDERGLIQPEDPHRVLIEHPRLGFEIPEGRFTLVDVVRGTVTAVTATPQLDYLEAKPMIEVVRGIDDAIKATAWDWEQLPNYDVLPAELPKVKGTVVLGEWMYESWRAELRVRAALEAGSDEARIAGMPGGGFLATIMVWDRETFR